MAKVATFDDRIRRISSRQNAQVKELRRLFHEGVPNSNGTVAIEGMHMVEEAIRSSLRVTAVFFSEAAHERAHRLLPQLSSHTDVLALPDDVFASAVSSEAPQGVAALVQVKAFTLEQTLAPDPALVVISAGIQDPGNLGTVARSAEAFGATGLLRGEHTVSPWNWKCLRASAGSLFRLPTLKVALSQTIDELKRRGLRVLATSSHKGMPIAQTELQGAIAVIVGSEGAGVSKDVMAQADEVIAIPHASRVESLNAGIAASIVLYEASRQRTS